MAPSALGSDGNIPDENRTVAHAAVKNVPTLDSKDVNLAPSNRVYLFLER